MKKIIAVLLAAVMAVGILPIAALAADPIEITAETYADNSSVTLGGNRSYKLLAGNTAVIKEGDTWTVEAGSTLIVYGELDIKGTLVVNGNVRGVDDGKVVAKCWTDDSGATYKHCTIENVRNICGNETNSEKRYFAEVHMPALSQYPGFTDPAHQLRVRYLSSATGSEYDYIYSDVYYPYLENPEESEPRWYFADVYTSPDYNPATGMLTVPLNQYLFLYFDFLNDGAVAKKYDGSRMTVYFNKNRADAAKGVCTHLMDRSGAMEFRPTVIANQINAAYNVWKDSYFLRQERIYIPSGNGYTTFGVNGEISANDQTVRLNYGEEFTFRVTIDSAYSDSAYAVYLVRGYKWNERNHEDTLENMVDEVYVDEYGELQHFVWKFEDYHEGEQQKVYIDSNGIYHIASVEDEYTIMVTGVVSNETLSLVGNVMDTIRNLINALKQLFDRVRMMLGLA